MHSKLERKLDLMKRYQLRLEIYESSYEKSQEKLKIIDDAWDHISNSISASYKPLFHQESTVRGRLQVLM